MQRNRWSIFLDRQLVTSGERFVTVFKYFATQGTQVVILFSLTQEEVANRLNFNRRFSQKKKNEIHLQQFSTRMNEISMQINPIRRKISRFSRSKFGSCADFSHISTTCRTAQVSKQQAFRIRLETSFNEYKNLKSCKYATTKLVLH